MSEMKAPGTIIEGDVIVQGGDFVAGDKYVHIVEDPAAQRERRGQRILLEKVSTFWVEGVLENALSAVGRLDIRSISRPDLLAQPWDPVVDDNLAPVEPSPITSLRDCFEDCQHALLITGGPGSGKTSALLSLARDFIETARINTAQPIPVVFHLATWGARRHHLEDWLVDELNQKYQIPRDAARRWLLTDSLLLLLDGLDEVPEAYRDECVREINRFRETRGLVSIAVCSRLEEYERCGVRLNLGAAVLLQQLEPEQVRQAVIDCGAELEGLAVVLDASPELRELSQSPLMLSLIAQVFRNTGGTAVLQEGRQTVEHLLDAYVQAAFHRRGRLPDAEVAQIRHHLTYLARKMIETNQSIFLVERLQPGWLKPSSSLPYALLTRGVFGCIAGLLYLALLFSLFRGYSLNVHQFFNLGVLPGLLGGLAAGLFFYLRMRRVEWSQPATVYPQTGRFRLFLRRYIRPVFNAHSLVVGFVSAVWAVTYNLINNPSGGGTIVEQYLTGIVGITVVPFLYFLCFSAIYGFAFPAIDEPPLAEIDPVEAVRWSWRDAWQGTLVGAALSVGLGAAAVFLANLVIAQFGMATPTSPLIILLASLLVAVAISILIGVPVTGIFAVLWGLRGKGVERGTQPNQGIRQSLRSARFSFLLSGAAGGLLILGQRVLVGLAAPFVTGDDPLSQPLTYLVIFFAFALFLGGISGLRNGGGAVIQHYLLRALLRLEGALPWKLVRLLERAVSLTLLRRAGSGYLFPHRVFLEYFAKM